MLASVATIVDFNPQSVKEILAKVGVNFEKRDEERLLRVKNWITKHQPSKMYKLLSDRNDEYYATLSDEEKTAIKALADFVEAKDGIGEQEVQQYLYSIINKPELTKKENTVRQQRFLRYFTIFCSVRIKDRDYIFPFRNRQEQIS